MRIEKSKKEKHDQENPKSMEAFEKYFGVVDMDDANMQSNLNVNNVH